MFPKFTEFIADEQPKSRLAEAERIRLAGAFQPEKSPMKIKQTLVIVMNSLLKVIK